MLCFILCNAMLYRKAKNLCPEDNHFRQVPLYSICKNSRMPCIRSCQNESWKNNMVAYWPIPFWLETYVASTYGLHGVNRPE